MIVSSAPCCKEAISFLLLIYLWQVGDLIFGKLLAANKDLEAELVCIDGLGRSSGMGVIRNGGFMFQTSLYLAKK